MTWTEDGTPDAPIAVLLEHGATRGRNGVDLGDVHIDLIAVSDYEPDQLPGDVDDKMFVITHTYGMSSATLLTIEARDAHDASTRATARVATPAALVAMKLRAMQQRRANVLNKRASDAYDAYRLLAAHDRDGSIARTLAGHLTGWAHGASRVARSVRRQRQPDAAMACHGFPRNGRGQHRRAPNGRLPLRRRPRRSPTQLTIRAGVCACSSTTRCPLGDLDPGASGLQAERALTGSSRSQRQRPHGADVRKITRISSVRGYPISGIWAPRYGDAYRDAAIGRSEVGYV